MQWAAAFLCLLAIAEDHDRRPVMAVSGPRPVADAADLLERKYQYLVTYEDPDFAFPGDTYDATAEVRRDHPPRRIFIANKRSFSVHYDLDAAGDPADIATLVQRIADAGGGDGLRFEARQAGPHTFHIVPVQVRDARGMPAPFTSPLDVRITMPAERRDVGAFLRAFDEAIARASRFEVKASLGPPNWITEQQVSRGAHDEVARDVLADALPGVSWRLFSQPGAGYFLNLYAAPDVSAGRRVRARFR